MKTIHGMECMHIMESETNRFVYEEDIRRRYGSMAICLRYWAQPSCLYSYPSLWGRQSSGGKQTFRREQA